MEEPVKEKDKISVSKKIKLIMKKFGKFSIVITLIVLIIISILFALKQAGIYDATKLLGFSNKKQNSQQNIMEVPVEAKQSKDNKENMNLMMPSTSTASNISSNTETQNTIPAQQISSDTQPPSSTSASHLTLATTSKKEIQKDKTYDEKIKKQAEREIKNYRISNKLTLYKAIKEVIKYRKANLLKTKWILTQKNQQTFRLMVISPVNRHRKLKFYFQYNYKDKIIQPLNTLSKNTLKLLLKKNTLPKKKNKRHTVRTKKESSKKTQKKESDNTSNKKDNETSKQTASDQTDSSQDSGEFLIIGE
jgi:predicted amidophosphoribosyltransferase